MNIKDISKKSIILFMIAFIIRLIASFVLHSFEDINYYEYGTIAQNIINGSGFAFFSNPANHAEFAKGAYMPVGAVLYTVPFFLIKHEILRNALYLIINHAIAGLSVVLLYKAVSNRFNEISGFVTALIATFLPEFIFASSALVNTNLYHLFVAYILYFFSIRSSYKLTDIVSIAVVSGVMLLFRSEVALMILIMGFIISKNSSLKKVIIYLTISFSFLAPWSIRNYVVLNKFVPLTTNFGINLYRGHNPLYPGAWADDRMDSLKSELKFSEQYELEYIELQKQEAISQIKADPLQAFASGFTKLCHLWGYYPYSNQVKHLLYIVPWFLMLGLAIWGGVKSKISDFKIEYIMLFYHSFIAFIFFAIPRYQTMMKFWLLPLVGWGIYMIYETIQKKRNG